MAGRQIRGLTVDLNFCLPVGQCIITTTQPSKYKLLAVIPNQSFFGDLTASRPLNFSPYRQKYITSPPPPLVWPEIITLVDDKHRTLEYHLHGDGVPRAITMKDGIKNFFRHKEAHEALRIEFQVEIQCPKVLIPGQPFPLTLRLTCRGSSTSNSSPKSTTPVFLLKQLRVSMNTSVTLRRPTISMISSDPDIDYDSVDELLFSMNSDFNPDAIQIPLEIDGPPIKPTPRAIKDIIAPRRMAPSLATYLIGTSHHLEIQFMIESLGEEFKGIVKIPDVEVLENVVAPIPEQVESGLEMEAETGRDNEPPPAYSPSKN